MKLHFQDLINHLNQKPTKDEVSDRLFQLGHEHEVNGEIFDMEITPNRGDCLSIVGLARDLNIFFGMSKIIEIYEDNIEPLEISFENLSPQDCPKISFLEIELEEQKELIEYKPYLHNYFTYLGNNKTNLFSDISNYISYELGQPTHCYDYETIKNKLVFENKPCNQKFKTLLGQEINLRDSNCIFSSGNNIVSLAGIMGGSLTACSDKTTKALVECAYFNPESIIGKAVKYNLTSDAAHKFERGVDIDAQEYVLRRFIKIIQDHAKITSIKIKTFESKYSESKNLPINVNKINHILGTELDEKEYLKYLKCFGFEVESNIRIPSYRNDIKSQNDLAEEIARAIGYNNIESSPIIFDGTMGDQGDLKINTLQSFLVNNGFFEVINFPFTSKKENRSIKLDNPLDSNRKNLRIDLKDSLIENLLYNERRQKDSIKLFEISDIHTKESVIKKQKKLGIIISGRLGHNHNDFLKKLDFSYLNQLLNLDLNDNFFQVIEIERKNLETKKKDKIYYVESAIDDIPDDFFSNLKAQGNSINFIKYLPISEFPSSTRDFSFSINDLSVVDKVINILELLQDEIIKNSFIFDYYKDVNMNLVKLGYRITFQSHHKTLSDDEINKKVQNILSPILEIDGVTIPGMKDYNL